MNKLFFVAGVGVGYVLGARAGRKRYEQIRSAAQNLWENDNVQRSVTHAQEFAKEHVGDVADTVYTGAKKVVGTVVGSKQAFKSAGDKTDSTGKNGTTGTGTTSANKPTTTNTTSSTSPSGTGSSAS